MKITSHSMGADQVRHAVQEGCPVSTLVTENMKPEQNTYVPLT